MKTIPLLPPVAVPKPGKSVIKYKKGVALTRSYVAIVDDEDYERVIAAGPWFAYESSAKPRALYAHRSIRKPDGSRTTEKMHRFILGLTDPKIQPDHRDRDGLNNQRSNLRIATASQNMANRRKRRGPSSSQYMGVHKRSDSPTKWRASIRVNRKLITLGSFTSELTAALAYDKAAREHFGEFANTNFTKEG
jgi:HNH endonuclease